VSKRRQGREGDLRAGQGRRQAATIEADVVLVATGRKPYTRPRPRGSGVTMDKRGRVEIDGHFKTNVPGIYAIGDVVGPDAGAQGRG
jgi:pyruvate/2-oxoglutarate dehydrogenase complex dihydrolipoamide dehydrogenase (E3) component